MYLDCTDPADYIKCPIDDEVAAISQMCISYLMLESVPYTLSQGVEHTLRENVLSAAGIQEKTQIFSFYLSWNI